LVEARSVPQVCTICTHPERGTIDATLCNGSATERGLARRFGLVSTSLRRHRQRHLPRAMVKAQEAEEVARADSLLEQVRDLQETTLATLTKADAAGDLATVLRAVREARENLSLLAKLLGELDERPVVNLILSPEWLAVRAVLLAALGPHPAARVEVAAALAGLENGHAR
jgi:hypothetical protein